MEYFTGRTVLLTGGSGFVGTALACRLAFDTPVACIYILCRGGENRLWSRWGDVLPAHIVAKLRGSGKVRVVEGDITKETLGMDAESQFLIRNSVSVIIHAASSINLGQELGRLAPSVVYASLDVARFALSCESLDRFVYVSTAYTNAHLHYLHDGIDTVVKEQIYPLCSTAEEETCHIELAEFEESGKKPIKAAANNFPWGYSYAKHLTERLLTSLFADTPRKFMILRPSVIGPALALPFPGFEVCGSTPLSTIIAGLICTSEVKIHAASRFPDPLQQSSFDEVPVDIVVNRLLVHLVHGTTGCVHAVSGEANRLTMGEIWDEVVARRRFHRVPELSWTNTDWRSPSLHPIMRLFSVMGASFLFEENKTSEIWEHMDQKSRAMWPLFWTEKRERRYLMTRQNALMGIIRQDSKGQEIPEWIFSSMARPSL